MDAILAPIFKVLHINDPWMQIAFIAALGLILLLSGRWLGSIMAWRQFESLLNLTSVSVQVHSYEPDPLNDGKRTVLFMEVEDIPLHELTKDRHLAKLVVEAANAADGEVNFILLAPTVHKRLMRAMPGPAGRKLQLGEGPFIAALVFERFKSEGLVLQLKVFLISEELLLRLGAPELETLFDDDVAKFAANLAQVGIHFRSPSHADRIKSFRAMRKLHEQGGTDAHGRKVIFFVNSRPQPEWMQKLAQLVRGSDKSLRRLLADQD
jgi:hypothetical protein